MMKLRTLAGFMFVMLLAAPALADEPAPANQITISNFRFAPNALTVPVGTKVTWVNHDQVPHMIADSAAAKTFRSAALNTDDTYSFTFTKPGSYKYVCTLHPQMVGTVTVTAN